MDLLILSYGILNEVVDPVKFDGARIYDISQHNRMNHMDSNVIQLELDEKSITVKTEVLRGVLTSKTFHGHDCYLQLLSFVKEAFSGSNAITATIFIK
jgi:hypothetical protein